jgi:K+-sensing histidine kinase KdpD
MFALNFYNLIIKEKYFWLLLFLIAIFCARLITLSIVGSLVSVEVSAILFAAAFWRPRKALEMNIIASKI